MRYAPFRLTDPDGVTWNVIVADCKAPLLRRPLRIYLPRRFDVGALIVKGWRFA